MNSYELFGASDGKIKLFMSDEHKFGTDSLLLAKFIQNGKSLKKLTVADLCSGCGIIPVMLCLNKSDMPSKIYAVEIQSDAADLIRRTLRENELSGIIEVIEGDLRSGETLNKVVEDTGSLDLVTANPPYYPEKSGFERNSSKQKTARYEGECTLTDVVKAAGRLLKFGGELKMCMTAPRLCECIAVMRENSIEPKEIALIPGKNNIMRLFLISGKKGGKSGVVTRVWEK